MNIPTIEELLNYLSRADKSVKKLTKQSNSYNNEAKYKNIKVELESLKTTTKANFFGLRFMGLGNQYSNLDMFMETGDNQVFYSFHP